MARALNWMKPLTSTTLTRAIPSGRRCHQGAAERGWTEAWDFHARTRKLPQQSSSKLCAAGDAAEAVVERGSNRGGHLREDPHKQLTRSTWQHNSATMQVVRQASPFWVTIHAFNMLDASAGKSQQCPGLTHAESTSSAFAADRGKPSMLRATKQHLSCFHAILRLVAA